MRKEVFRKKSIEKLNKPDEIDQCIHVIPPYVWLLLAAVVAILIGAIVWSVFGVLETEKTCIGYINDGKIYIFLPATTDYHINMNTNCYINDNNRKIPISLEITDVKMPLEEILEEDNSTDALNLSQWSYGLMNAIYQNEKHDFSEVFVSRGTPAEKKDDGFALVVVNEKSGSLYQLMFS